MTVDFDGYAAAVEAIEFDWDLFDRCYPGADRRQWAHALPGFVAADLDKDKGLWTLHNAGMSRRDRHRLWMQFMEARNLLHNVHTEPLCPEARILDEAEQVIRQARWMSPTTPQTPETHA